MRQQYACLGPSSTTNTVEQHRGPETARAEGGGHDAEGADVDPFGSETAKMSSMEVLQLLNTADFTNLLPTLAAIEPLEMDATDVLYKLMILKQDLNPRR